MYHLMSHLDLDDGVLYPMGGFTEIITRVESLAASSGVVIETARRVAIIDRRHRRGVAAGVEIARRRPRASPRDVVVSAADLHHTETTCSSRGPADLPREVVEAQGPGPGALLLLLGVKGELPELAHHTLLFTDDWQPNFDAIFGEDQPIPDPASLYVCRPSATDRLVAPEGHENLFVLVPFPPTRLGRGGVDGDGDPRIEAVADRVDRADRDVGRHPGSRRAHRGAPHDRTRRLRRRPQRLARHRARPRAHAQAERVLPPGNCRARSKACSTRAGRRSRASACRCA